MTHEPTGTVPGNIELRHYANATLARVSDDLAHLVLSVEETIGTEGVKPGKFLALDAKALILCEVPMQDVQLYGRHRVEVPLEYVHRLEVTADVDEQAAPGKARLIVDPDTGNVESVAIALEQLQESLQAT